MAKNNRLNSSHEIHYDNFKKDSFNKTQLITTFASDILDILVLSSLRLTILNNFKRESIVKIYIFEKSLTCYLRTECKFMMAVVRFTN